MSRLWKMVFIAGSFLAMTLFTSCSNQSLTDNTGSATIGVSTQALSATDVAKVTITVSGDNINPSIVQNLVKAGGQWKGIIGKIPAGSNRTFLAEAHDSNDNVIYEGSITNQTITKGAPLTVVILLQQKTQPDPFLNTVPRIDSIVASSNAVGPGETVSLTAAASDPDAGHATNLTYAWTASGGSFTNGNTATPTWTAPTGTGTYTLTLTVTDPKSGKVTATLSVGVEAHYARGKAKVSVSFNTWPEIASVTASKGRINKEETTALTLVASDADNDTLSYAWTSKDGCGGSFNSSTAKNPVFTAPVTIPTNGICTLEVTVTDGRGGSNTGDITIQIGAPLDANRAPQLTTTFQSAEMIEPGDAVTLRVVAVDPDSNSMTFAWNEVGGPNGTLGTPVQTATTSEVVWTPSTGKCEGTIRLTVTDDGNPQGTTTHDFMIQCDNQLTISTKDERSCVAISGGGVKCWGITNSNPNMTISSSSTPVIVQLPLGRTAKQVTAGQYHSCAILDDNKAYCWGYNDSGELGDGSSTTSSTPVAVQLPSGLTAKQISVGSKYTCAILDDNKAYCWGYNMNGQLGNGSTTNSSTPVAVQLPSGRTAKQISAGYTYNCAILDDNKAYCWGENTNGQLGNGNTTNSPTPVAVQLPPGRTAKQISAGSEYTCAILDNNKVYCWGYNMHGQLGDGSTTSSFAPVAVQLPSGRTAKQISAGTQSACAILDNNKAYCWGYNVVGQLGNGNTTNSSTPVAVQLPSGRTATQIFAGGGHACAILDDYKAYCWGYNANGQLGNGNQTPSSTPVAVQLP